TDVKGFSTISEALDPSDLVKLLNRYLTTMSDIILAQKGTIDKYEGDAIIAFFGAPLELPDHTARACQSAIFMKRAERELNKVLMEEQATPTPLMTRIGINTGEMVVGNMGTAQKMDYTIMGNAVNLAARLEGVNKQYGTWLLISEAVYDNGGKDFVTRRLDRVRVVGIHQPVRLYELYETPGQVSSEEKEMIDSFHKGQELFEAKDWSGAERFFEKALTLVPDDGPSTTFLKRCQEYKLKAPPEGWDGVFNLTSK
ncbi:MAG: adenylate/guanylate cyclase domain-containing protein, partial [Spirochaetales bacterium]